MTEGGGGEILSSQKGTSWGKLPPMNLPGFCPVSARLWLALRNENGPHFRVTLEKMVLEGGLEPPQD